MRTDLKNKMIDKAPFLKKEPAPKSWDDPACSDYRYELGPLTKHPLELETKEWKSIHDHS